MNREYLPRVTGCLPRANARLANSLGSRLAIAYRSQVVPQPLMNLMLNNGIVQEHVKTTIIYMRILN